MPETPPSSSSPIAASEAPAIKAVGLLGGSFNPVHNAHLALARAALASKIVQEVALIPAHTPAQKGTLAATPEQRLTMLELAFSEQPDLQGRVRINTLELARGGTTYTIDTVSVLPPDCDYYWLMGSDQLQNFTNWRCWSQILERVRLWVVQRPGSSLQIPEALQPFADRIQELDFSPLPISSTEIRRRVASGANLSDLLPASVAQYIAEQGLYRDR